MTMVMPVPRHITAYDKSSSPMALLHAVQSLSSLGDRPCSTVATAAPTLIPLMQAAPMDRYYVTMYQPPQVFQPQISMPAVDMTVNTDYGSNSSASDGAQSPVAEQEKLKQRLARKAELARLSRKRKKVTMNQMHDEFEHLQRENRELKAELAAVRAALAQKCTCTTDHDGDAPDMGLLKRESTPALVELSPVSSPLSIASSLPRVPSALDLSKSTSEGVASLTALTASSPVRFSAKSSAFSPFKSLSSKTFSATRIRPRSHVPLSSSSSSDDCQVIEPEVKKQKH